MLQVVFGWPGGKVTPFLITVGSAALAVVLLGVGELVLNWWRAPALMLLDEVRGLRESIAAIPDQGRSGASPSLDPRAALLKEVYRGRALLEQGRWGTGAIEGWTEEAAELIGQHVSADAVAEFVNATDEPRSKGLRVRVTKLEEIADRL